MIPQQSIPANNAEPEPHISQVFLTWLHDPGDVFEIRAPKCPDKPGSKWKNTVAGWFDDPALAAKAIDQLEQRHPAGIYVTVNPVNPGLLARSSNRLIEKPEQSTSDNDVRRRRWLFLDIDPERPSGISSTPGELDHARKLAEQIRDDLVAQGWTTPLFGMSGNGFYLLFRINLPNDDQSLALVKAVTEALAVKYNTDLAKIDTTGTNASRIIKVLGTVARKGEDYQPADKPESQHRPHRQSWFENPGMMPQSVSRELLEAIAGPSMPASSTTTGIRKLPRPADFDLETWLHQHHVPVSQAKPWNGSGKRWVLTDQALCDHDADGTGFVAIRDSGAIVAGCQHNHCGWGWRELREHYEPGCYSTDPPNGGSETTPDGEVVFKAPRPAAAPVDDYVPFPTDCLPGDVARFITEASNAIGCDHAYIALPLLTALGACIGNARRLVVKRTWYAPPTIWTAIVGESGTLKTPAQKEALSAVKQIQSEALQVYAEELKVYEADLMAYERDVAAFKRDKSGQMEPPIKPEHPHPSRVLVQNTTVEALAPILIHNPKGLLLCRDELAGWFGSFNRYSGKRGADEADWMSMFDGDSITVDRKGDGTAPIYVPSALLSITGGIQPAILKTALSPEHRSSGLAARILMAAPPRVAPRWTENELSVVARDLMTGLFRDLVDLHMTPDEEGNLQPGFVGMSEAAKRTWRDYYNDHQSEGVDRIGDDAAAWSKLLGYVPRFALMIHLIRQASGEVTSDQVDTDSLNAAITLVDWFKREADRVYATLDDDAVISQLRQLADWIKRKHSGAVTPRELVHGIKRIGSVDEAEAELKKLADANLGAWDSTDRKKRVFRIH